MRHCGHVTGATAGHMTNVCRATPIYSASKCDVVGSPDVSIMLHESWSKVAVSHDVVVNRASNIGRQVAV